MEATSIVRRCRSRARSVQRYVCVGVMIPISSIRREGAESDRSSESTVMAPTTALWCVGEG